MISPTTLFLLSPEIALVLVATMLYVVGAFWPGNTGWCWLAGMAFVGSSGMLIQQMFIPFIAEPVFNGSGLVSGPVTLDLFSVGSRLLLMFVGLIFVMMAARTAADSQETEALGSLVMMVCGMNLISMSNDLVFLFMGLEMVSIPTYIILFIGSGHVERYAAQRQEAATKYFFLSILSSGLLLYGFSFLYGVTGTTRLDEIVTVLSQPAEAHGTILFARLALVLIFAALGFRLTAVPFHFYAPDVYQGTSNFNAGLLAVVPKCAALMGLVRLIYAMPGLEQIGWQLTLAMAIVTMTLGNIVALWQKNIRRMMAYSSIAHAGYMLIGLSVGYAIAGGAEGPVSIDGFGAAMFYLVVYILATAGTFAAITYLSSSILQIDRVEDLCGLSQTYPRTAVALAVFMFSLTGLPPLAGFWGKLGLFTGALGVDSASGDLSSGLWPWFLMLAVVGVLNAAVSAAYYLRVVAYMYFRPPMIPVLGRGGVGAATATGLCGVLVVAVGIFPGTLQELANTMCRSARNSMASHEVVTTVQPTATVAKADE